MNPPSVTLRIPRAGEAATLSALARRSKAHWGYSAAQLDAWHDDLSVSERSLETQIVRVAETGGVLAGFFCITPPPPGWQLEHLWVAPDCMRRGVGRVLLRAAHAAIAEADGGVLQIDADPHAEAFYLWCGATRVAAVAAPICGEPLRTRPQLELACGATLR